MSYISNHSETVGHDLRFDVLDISKTTDGTAMIRHHINAYQWAA